MIKPWVPIREIDKEYLKSPTDQRYLLTVNEHEFVVSKSQAKIILNPESTFGTVVEPPKDPLDEILNDMEKAVELDAVRKLTEEIANTIPLLMDQKMEKDIRERALNIVYQQMKEAIRNADLQYTKR